MRFLILALLIGTPALAASDSIYLPNVPGMVTGTVTGLKKGLDTYVSGGGGMQTEDAAHASGDSGVMALCVRNDAGAALAGDGDYIPCTTDNTGALRVNATEVATVADGGALPGVVKVIGGYDGSNVRVIKTDSGGAVQVDVESSALPTGAATSALQTTGNTSLASIDTFTQSVNSYALLIATDTAVLAAASPTNTGHLSDISTKLTTIDGRVDQLEGYVDGIETLIGTTNSSLSSIDATASSTLTAVDGLETLVGTTNSTLSTIATSVAQTPQNANVTDSTNQTVGVAAVTEAAPSDAVGFELSADPANTGIVYYRLGGTATTSAGHPLEASRDTGFMPVKATISLIASAASQKYNLTWIRR